MADEEIKCLILDDEPIARRIIRNYLDRLPGYRVVAECASVSECKAYLQQQQVDLLFLDIEMPLMNGLQYLRTQEIQPKVIIISAHRQYALDGFELEVLDYLLKPVPFERFQQALAKFQRQRGEEKVTPKIALRVDRANLRLSVQEILYVESTGDYLKVYCPEKMLLTKETMKSFAARAPEEFLQIHRSYLVNTRYIKAYTNDQLQVSNKTLPISRSYRQAVSDKMSN